MIKQNRDEISINTDVENRFWEKVDIRNNEDCWIWTAGTQSKGYGSFALEPRKTILSHRFAYELNYGDIPENLCVMHSCDNRICCNPAYLKLGSISDNVQDMVNKGRHAKGENHGNSKLTRMSVITMRSDFRAGEKTIKELSGKYKIHELTAQDVIEGKTWKHLPLAK